MNDEALIKALCLIAESYLARGYKTLASETLRVALQARLRDRFTGCFSTKTVPADPLKTLTKLRAGGHIDAKIFKHWQRALRRCNNCDLRIDDIAIVRSVV
jgi:hypothetical protein